MSFGTVTPELDQWLTEHADPAYKPYRFPNKRKESVRKFSRSDVASDMKDYEYTFGFDFRTVREPVSLSRFLVLKSDPKFKAWALPKRRVAGMTLSAKARSAESARIARFVASRAA